MVFEQIVAGGCQSYVIGCAKTSAAAVMQCESPARLADMRGHDDEMIVVKPTRDAPPRLFVGYDHVWHW